MRIGVIGLGTIATALVEGIAAGGHAITVSTRSGKNASRLSGKFANVTVADNQAVIDASDLVFLGMMAEAAPGILGPLDFRAGQRVISLMADAGFGPVAELVSPATLLARTIPFPAIATGGSPILTYGDRSLIDELFGARNKVFALDREADLVACLYAQAVLSPAASMVKYAADWLGNLGPDREMAEEFLRTLVGASLLGSRCTSLLHSLDTPGGYNQRLREHMLEAGLREDLQAGLDRLVK